MFMGIKVFMLYFGISFLLQHNNYVYINKNVSYESVMKCSSNFA